MWESVLLRAVKTVLFGGCSKRLSTRPQAEQTPEVYPLGYIEDFCETRTTLRVFFSSRLSRCLLVGMCRQDDDLHRLRQYGSRWARISGHVLKEQERQPVHGYRVDSTRWPPPPVPCGEHSSRDYLCGAGVPRQCLVSRR